MCVLWKWCRKKTHIDFHIDWNLGKAGKRCLLWSRDGDVFLGYSSGKYRRLLGIKELPRGPHDCFPSFASRSNRAHNVVNHQQLRYVEYRHIIFSLFNHSLSDKLFNYTVSELFLKSFRRKPWIFWEIRLNLHELNFNDFEHESL